MTLSPQLLEIEQSIETMLNGPIYSLEPDERKSRLLGLMKQQLAYACDRNPRFRNYVAHWPIDFENAETIADLPYLPAGVFKANPPLSLISPSEIKRTIVSSATSGQTPSRVVLDAATSKRTTKSVAAIMKEFIGPERRPYLVVDTPENLMAHTELGARAAAIQGLGSFATELVPCLQSERHGDPELNLQKLFEFAEKRKDVEILVYGFTYVIWTRLVQPLREQGITLRMPNVHVFHSGGWKRLEQEAVSKEFFTREAASVFGCETNRVIDYYGMVENIGVIYPDCVHGNKHVAAFAEVMVRNPLTLAPVAPGQQGLVQVCSVLPTSFPGFLVLTDDIAELIGDDGCPCGRRGTHFRFVRRVPNAEPRGCGNLEATRHAVEAESYAA
jgi:phenylacetate-coenzyme A ligase PaaK-like adenylate-forming protein